MNDDGLLFAPLGGAGEIGMNMSLYGHRGRWLLVDMGIAFGDDSTPGVEVMTPDPAFAAELGDRLEGLVLTHAHEDHLGAVPYLWPRLRCPVYGTPFACGLLRRKLRETRGAPDVPLTEVPAGGRVALGPFVVDFIPAAHSIPEAHVLAIRTGAGIAVHATDWKLDPDPLVGPRTDEAALRALGDEGVLALVCDSTNAFVDGGAGSEAALRESLTGLVRGRAGRVAVASFASNVARVETVASAAAATGRRPALVGRSLERVVDVARECGYLADVGPFADEDEIRRLPPDRLLAAVTGSQGEPRSALARVAAGSHPVLALEEGDMVIFSSREIPGNERAIGRLQNRLAGLGVEVITERDGFVHVSGHPARDELMRMHEWLRPRIFVPVHGELRHLRENVRLARAWGTSRAAIAENGEMLRLDRDGVAEAGRVRAGRLAVDGSRLVPLEGNVVRERDRLRRDGAATATVALDGDGALLGDPRFTSQGVLDETDDAAARAEVVAAIAAAVGGLPPDGRGDDAAVSKAVRGAVRRVLARSVGKRPVTDVHVVRP